jgi:F0F1-type ATP synthase membrane subunit c/vacuolar-type H+-ATPase subunit K
LRKQESFDVDEYGLGGDLSVGLGGLLAGVVVGYLVVRTQQVVEVVQRRA